MVITIECPSCADSFPVDPAKIPEAGVNARCSSCGEIFRIERPAEESAVAEPEVEAPPEAIEEEAPPEAIEEEAPPEAIEEEAPPEAIEEEETFESVEEETVEEETVAEEPEAEEPIARDDFAAVTEEPAAESDFGAFEEPADEPLAEAPTEEAEADLSDSPGDWVIETEVEVDAAELEVEPVGTVEEEAHAALDENAFFVGAGGAAAADTAEEVEKDYDEGAIELSEEPTIEITEEPAEAAAEVTDDLPSFSFGDDAAVADDVATDDELPSFDDAPTEEVLEEAPAFEEASFEEVAVEETVIEETVIEEVVEDTVEDVPAMEEATEEPESEPEPAVTGFTFGKRDPKDKAKRLARVLVSDMIEYNRDRHTSALAGGTLKEDFEEEIEKSWKEYVEQVGAEMAEGDGQEFWRAALNDVLAQGEQLF
jgi:predicted Zn finger-like uncharacterized protein